MVRQARWLGRHAWKLAKLHNQGPPGLKAFLRRGFPLIRLLPGVPDGSAQFRDMAAELLTVAEKQMDKYVTKGYIQGRHKLALNARIVNARLWTQKQWPMELYRTLMLAGPRQVGWAVRHLRYFQLPKHGQAPTWGLGGQPLKTSGLVGRLQHDYGLEAYIPSAGKLKNSGMDGARRSESGSFNARPTNMAARAAAAAMAQQQRGAAAAQN